jgi:hypothetical protein
LLAKRAVEYYYPIHLVADKKYNLNKISTQPLSPYFIFVHVAQTEHEHLKKIKGVTNLMYWHNAPAVFREVEIDMIRRFLQEHAVVQLKKAVVNRNGIVKICTNLYNEKVEDSSPEIKNETPLVLPSIGNIIVGEKKTYKVAFTKTPISQMGFFRRLAVAR